MASAPQTDLYGFPLVVTQLQKAERDECDAVSDRLQASWMEFIEVQTLPKDNKLKDMVRKGIPPTVRTWVWTESSGAAAKKAKHAGNYYSIMVAAGQSSPCRKDIEQDVEVTFSNHPWLGSSDGHDALRRVLLAYSVHNDKVGYCRAMNNIVAILLVAMNRNQEHAFWLLAALVEDHLYPGTYSRHMEGCQVEMEALDELISQKLPKLHAHLRATDTDVALMATDWYLCLYSTTLPCETVVRIWDALYNEGPKILFRVAIALLQMNEALLLSKNNAGDILMAMRQIPSGMHNRDALMAMAFDGIGGVPMATIERFRLKKEADVKARAGGRGGGAAPPPADTAREGSGADLGKKAKAGFGKFMGGLTKLVDRTKEEMNKLSMPDNGVPSHPAPPHAAAKAAAPAPPPAAAAKTPSAASEEAATSSAAHPAAAAVAAPTKAAELDEYHDADDNPFSAEPEPERPLVVVHQVQGGHRAEEEADEMK